MKSDNNGPGGWLLVAAWLAAAGPAPAQDAVDLSARAERVERKEVEKKTMEMPRDRRFVLEPMPMRHWAGESTQPGDRPARLTVEESRGKDVLVYARKEFSRKLAEGKAAGEEPARIGTTAERRTPEKARGYNDGPIAQLGPSQAEYQALAGELSLRDINKFQFRKNHDYEEGIPVTPAGSGGEEPAVEERGAGSG